MSNSKKRTGVAVVAILALATGLVVAIAARGMPGRNAGPKPGAPPAPPARPGSARAEDTVSAVRASAAEKKTLRPYLDLNGDVEAETNVAVLSEIAGKLVSIRVSVGDRVGKGDVVAEVDPSKPGASYALSAVLSPITGTVTSVPVQIGESVGTSTTIVKVGIIDRLEVIVLVPERDVAKLRLGMPAAVRLEALPGEELQAIVSKLSPVVDSVSRTKEIRLKLTGQDPRVNSGMFAKVRLYTDAVADAIVVPESAIVTRSGKTYAFVVSGAGGQEKAQRRDVRKGASVDGVTAILEGIAEGERIVTVGQELLSDGTRVRVLADNGGDK